jgi:hypothetical protein
MKCVEKIKEHNATHMCHGQPSLVPYISLEGREESALSLELALALSQP